MMKRILLIAALLVVLLPLTAAAQGQAFNGSRIGWDQAAPDLATAQAYTYKYYADGATTATGTLTATCTGTASPFACSAAYPAFTPAPHTLLVSASNVAGETKSTPFAFTFVVQPAAPANLRIQ